MMKSFFLVTILFITGLLGPSVWAEDALQVTIAWKNVDTSRKIQLEKGPAITGPFVLLVQLDANTTSYLDAKNAPGDKACYRMAYFDAATVGPYSPPKCKTFAATVTSPPATVTVK